MKSKNNHSSNHICIIPSKGYSERLPNKNKQFFMGKPLFVHAIETSLASNAFSSIYLSSEDEEILNISSTYPITTIKRPHFLSDNNATVKDVCLHVLNNIELKSLETFSVIIPTSPLRKPKHIIEAYSLFHNNKNTKSVMSVIQLTHPPQRSLTISNSSKNLKPFLGPDFFKQTQKLEKLFIHDGTIIIARVEDFFKSNDFYSLSPFPYIIDPKESVDVDTIIDLKWAEFLYLANYKEKNMEKEWKAKLLQ